jgi:hypothetical protein
MAVGFTQCEASFGRAYETQVTAAFSSGRIVDDIAPEFPYRLAPHVNRHDSARKVPPMTRAFACESHCDDIRLQSVARFQQTITDLNHRMFD